MDIVVLDCTLRDGGYYNQWDFESGLVEKYLSAISKTGVHVVELGLRSFPKSGFHGAFAYSSEVFLATLNLPVCLKYAVMVDAKTILNSGLNAKEAINKLFVPAASSQVDIVRIAAHFSQIEDCQEIAEELKNLGYLVCLNMMQTGGRSKHEIEARSKTVANWNAIDVLYFADSIGNMSPSDIVEIVNTLRTSWSGNIGFHSHNNMGKANANCLEAINSTVKWIDVTVTGMGRGAGNAETEILLSELNNIGAESFTAEPLYELALTHFVPLKKEKGWGLSFAYHYSAMHKIHPSYAQELLSDRRYSASDVVGALRFLSESDSASFDTELVQKALDENDEHDLGGSWNARNWCEGEEILIFGAGPSLEKYRSAVQCFIDQREIKALSLNFHKSIPEKYIYAYAAADLKRLSLDVKRYRDSDKPMFSPARFMTPSLRKELRKFDLRDYDLKVVPETFGMGDTGCEIPQRLTVAYTISLCAVGGASRIFLVGFDGYSADDPRQANMVKTLEIIKKHLPQSYLTSLTPTTYPLAQSSIFAYY